MRTDLQLIAQQRFDPRHGHQVRAVHAQKLAGRQLSLQIFEAVEGGVLNRKCGLIRERRCCNYACCSPIMAWARRAAASRARSTVRK